MTLSHEMKCSKFQYLAPSLFSPTNILYSSLNIDNGCARGYDCQNLACNDELRINNSAENPEPPAGFSSQNLMEDFPLLKLSC